MGDEVTGNVISRYIANKNITPASLVTSQVKNVVTKQVAKQLGLGSLAGPVGWLLGWLFDKAKAKFTGRTKEKWGKEGAFQAFTSGMTGTQADYEAAKELRILEKRKDWMQKRKDEGKGYSKNKLEEVTNQINTIKKNNYYELHN